MKKILVVTLIAGFALRQTALCQTNATDASSAANPAASTDASDATVVSNVAKLATADTAAESNAPAATAEGNQPDNSAAMTNAPAATAEGNQPDNSAAMTNAPAATAASTEPAASVPMNEATAANSATNAQSPSATNESSAAEAGANMPAAEAVTNMPAAELPIVFQDVPITTAIESLARLGGINYLIDPKIGYGQADEHGVVKPEPILSLRWEHVTAEQALVALLDNYGLQLVENPKTRIYRITIKDPTAPLPLITRVIQLKYASTTNMLSVVQNSMTDKRSRVIADIRTSQMVVVATEREQAEIDTMIEQLDKPTRQVLIETRLIEVSSNPSTRKGVDWTGTLQAQNVSFGNGVLQPTRSASITQLPGASVATPAVTTPSGAVISPATVSTPGSSTSTTLNSQPQPSTSAGGFSLNTASGLTPNIGFLNADGAQAVLSFLNSSSDAQVVSTPRMVTLDNETATISVVRAFPIINVTAGTANTTGGSSLTYSNLGTILYVTPRISANDYIRLKVTPSVSSFAGTETVIVSGQATTADEFDLRSIDTQVLIPNGNTLVMGGLVQDNPNISYTKVPILGDIPGLGWAFKSENKTAFKDNLLIFITPTIVRDTDFHPATTDFLNSQPISLQGQMNPNSRWDSAYPQNDWSDPTLPPKGGQTQNSTVGKTSVAP